MITYISFAFFLAFKLTWKVSLVKLHFFNVSWLILKNIKWYLWVPGVFKIDIRKFNILGRPTTARDNINLNKWLTTSEI